jgi:alpha 1,2-mannosyltransferase
MSEADLATARAIHQEVYESIPSSFPSDLYHGEGIVLIGGDKYSWLSILSIKSIRSFGSTLPIEVIIPTEEEYEHDLCEDLLPALNGKCVLLYNVLGEEIMSKVEFSGFQYKALALIASSFENVFLLDSDNILVTSPDQFFDSEPFKKTGMLIWPDYWVRTASPHFYDITGTQVDETLQVREGKWPLKTPRRLNDVNEARYHDLQGTAPDISSESGQLMINKKTHVKTLILSLFYNLYGPGFFYPLISQGSSGEGDKDTFISAAVRGGETFYQIKSGIQSFGWLNTKGEFQGVSMGQRNPTEDYEQYKAIERKKDGLEGDAKFNTFNTGQASVFTVHANYPKLNPYLLFKENKLINEDGKEIRMYSDIPKFLPKLPKDKENEKDDDYFDFEMVQFKRMKFLLCDLNISLKYFNQISRTELCQFIDKHIEFLKANPV